MLTLTNVVRLPEGTQNNFAEDNLPQRAPYISGVRTRVKKVNPKKTEIDARCLSLSIL